MSRTSVASGRYCRLVRLQKIHVLDQRPVGGIDVVEDLRLGGVPQPLVAADVDLRARFLALIPVEDAQRDADTGADVLLSYGLLNEGLWVHQTLNVGSVEPLATASWWVILANSTFCTAAFRSGRASRAMFRNSSSGLNSSVKSNGPETSNCSIGVRSFKSIRSWILAVRRFTMRGFEVGFELNALQSRRFRST